MLLSDTEEEWNIAYMDASSILEHLPAKFEKLKQIHDRPSYYAGYYLRGLYCNIFLAGNTAAEVNHSSIISHLGDCGMWTISYQISKLMEHII